MVKKNPYVFTIGFNPKDPDHIQVAALLNELGKGNIASFLVRAVLAYTSNAKSNIDPILFEAMVKKIVAEQLAVQKTLQPEASPPETSAPAVKSILPFGSLEQQNILNGLASFRKNK